MMKEIKRKKYSITGINLKLIHQSKSDINAKFIDNL